MYPVVHEWTRNRSSSSRSGCAAGLVEFDGNARCRWNAVLRISPLVLCHKWIWRPWSADLTPLGRHGRGQCRRCGLKPTYLWLILNRSSHCINITAFRHDTKICHSRLLLLLLRRLWALLNNDRFSGHMRVSAAPYWRCITASNFHPQRSNQCRRVYSLP